MYYTVVIWPACWSAPLALRLEIERERFVADGTGFFFLTLKTLYHLWYEEDDIVGVKYNTGQVIIQGELPRV